MPTCKHCLKSFDGPYRKRYCSVKCQLESRTSISDSGCIEWTGAKTSAGYGLVNTPNGLLLTHRLSYELYVGLIADGLFVCHKCDNPSCVNVEHLFLGTQSENMQDCSNKGRSAWKGKTFSLEYRKKLSEGQRNSSSTERYKALEKARERLSEMCKNPDFRAARTEKILSTKEAKRREAERLLCLS